MVTFVKEFEQYILSDFKEESLISIVPGSQAEVYIQFVNAYKEMELTGKLNPNV